MDRYTAKERLAEQYADSIRLRIRQETHRRYGANPVSFVSWLIGHLDVKAGMLVADVGCGHGLYQPALLSRGAKVVGLDRSIGMAREAATISLAVVADAQALPLSDAIFNRVMCNHVLYHVPDQRRAMHELRRIARPGGRVVIATNGSQSNERMYETARLAAQDLGRPDTFHRDNPFRLEDVDRVREVFPGARVEVLPNEFVFPDAEPALRYWRTMRDDLQLEVAMRVRIQSIIEKEGSFRVPLVSGCFVCDS
ncbi:MAG: class I SAM-dependent methyltransferase [Candidatus Dormibacteraceae bacterium]